MPIMVKGDDVRSGTKAKARHGGLLPAQLRINMLKHAQMCLARSIEYPAERV